MKILCVIDSLGSGGAQRQLVALAKGFNERGHEVSFITYHEENFFKQSLDDVGIPVKTIIEPNYLKRLLKIRKYIRNQNVDAVLSFLEAANFIATLSGFPYRKWTLIVGERSSNPDIYKSLKLKFYRWFHFFTDYVVANSHTNIKMVRKINPLIKTSKCKVIYNLIDEVFWTTKEPVSQKSNKFHLVVVASHQYLKNAKGLIEALNILPEKDKKILNVSWYGRQGEDSSFDEALRLSNQYNLNNIISFTKETNQIKLIMQDANALGLFSFYEGLPNVICEAMTLGRPVVSSNVSDIPLFIDKDFTFNPTDVLEIKNILSKLINLPSDMLSDLGKKNRNVALMNFNKEKIISNYLKLMKK